jgi:hypothetical protein
MLFHLYAMAHDATATAPAETCSHQSDLYHFGVIQIVDKGIVQIIGRGFIQIIGRVIIQILGRVIIQIAVTERGFRVFFISSILR